MQAPMLGIFKLNKHKHLCQGSLNLMSTVIAWQPSACDKNMDLLRCLPPCQLCQQSSDTHYKSKLAESKLSSKIVFLIPYRILLAEQYDNTWRKMILWHLKKDDTVKPEDRWHCETWRKTILWYLKNDDTVTSEERWHYNI